MEVGKDLAFHECLRGQKELQHKENEVFEVKQKNIRKRDGKGRFCKDPLISKNVEKKKIFEKEMVKVVFVKILYPKTLKKISV